MGVPAFPGFGEAAVDGRAGEENCTGDNLTEAGLWDEQEEVDDDDDDTGEGWDLEGREASLDAPDEGLVARKAFWRTRRRFGARSLSEEDRPLGAERDRLKKLWVRNSGSHPGRNFQHRSQNLWTGVLTLSHSPHLHLSASLSSSSESDELEALESAQNSTSLSSHTTRTSW